MNCFAVYDLLYQRAVYIILDLPTIQGSWKIYYNIMKINSKGQTFYWETNGLLFIY